MPRACRLCRGPGLMNAVSPGPLAGHKDIGERYLSSVLQATSAVSAIAYIADHLLPPGQPVLLRAGEAIVIPEFADLPGTPAAADEVEADGPPSPIRFFSSSDSTACLLRVAPYALAPREPTLPEAGERRAGRLGRLHRLLSPCVWIGLAFRSRAELESLRSVDGADPHAPREQAGWLAHTLILVAGLLWDTQRVGRLLRDPTSQLPGRAEFQESLSAAYQHAATSGETLGLLLVNPDGFGAVNERLGREEGDRAVAQVAGLLRNTLRQDERIFRYGGAVFAVLMPAAEARAVEAVARKIRESLSGAYLDGAIRLMFSVGAAVYRSDLQADASLGDLGLLRRADHALVLAKRAGGGRSVLWNPDDEELPDLGVDRLSGIFTANTDKDYRNMLLLWDTVALLSASTGKPQLTGEFVERIHVALKPSFVAILECGDGGDFKRSPLALRASDAAGAGRELDSQQRALLLRVRDARKIGSDLFRGRAQGVAGSSDFTAHAIPICAGSLCLGCLYIEGPASSFKLDASDLVFLDALAGQLGLALDRVALAERLQQEARRERRRLREEVQDLRQAVQSAKLVYRSRQMHEVLDTLRTMAGTDVTLLIDGESGTGKEMLARAVHEMSARRHQPLVVVDCGAIAHNLIEAELFGHIKGAYTGALSTAAGRIAQAEGGTLFLDEIGEIPLDVQTRLLRFVQEKEISPVGATSARQVDTRIIAATNRDLAREVAAGRFREDLFYRLSVVRVTAPPLRDRQDDILPLARHFLDRFAVQYEKPLRRLEPGAELYLRRYEWPGNVRELQNRILRAVLLCSGESIPREALELRDESTVTPDDRPAAPDYRPADDSHEAGAFEDAWLALQNVLEDQVQRALAESTVAPVPLGRWLAEDLLREADRQAGGNARRAARDLGVAETTYRRQLGKLRDAQSQGLLLRKPVWTSAAAVLQRLVRSLQRQSAEPRSRDNALERARSLLLATVLERVSEKDPLGASLMGVTLPTYRRWRQLLLPSNDGMRHR